MYMYGTRLLIIKVINSYMPKLVRVSKYLESEFMREGNKSVREIS